MSEMDVLIEVARQLKSIRALAEGCSDPLILYLIDMAILEACEALSRYDATGEADPPAGVARASR